MATVSTSDLRRKVVTLKEGAEMLAISQITLRRAIRGGKIRFFRMGGKRGAIRIALEEIEEFIKRASEQNEIKNNQIGSEIVELKETTG